jgi:hypothetical protein
MGVLKCPACGRSGGPFRLKLQLEADSQVLRAWSCPCGHHFHAAAGAEGAPKVQTPYMGFTVNWNGRTIPVRLGQVNKRETAWKVGPWAITITGPTSGPGTRFVSLWGSADQPMAQWRLEASWSIGEITRRLKGTPLPTDLTADLLARILVRVLR